MSLNQSRVERNDSSHYRKSSRSGSSSQPRNFSGGSGKGGGTAPPPSSTNSSLSSNRRRSNNAQGGQSRVSGAGLNSNSNSAYAARALQNGSHLQPAVRADASTKGINVKPTMDVSMQESAQAVPKVPSSQPAAVNFDSASPTTPAKGDASRTFSLQFGSISPGFMNGMQIPARTSSAPPNLDEQQHDQARHDSLRVVPQFPIPPVPKQQISRNDGEQTNAGDAHQMSKAKRDAQVSSVPPVTHTQKASIHPVHGVSMPMPFHQPQIPVQFGPNPQIQPQGMAATSLPIPVPMPLTMGNAPQLQQPMFVSSLPPHPMQPQGIMHQGQTLNFTSQMGPQLTPQLGNLGVSIGSQFTQHQAGKFAARKPVKITHPDTHEELRLDKRADAHVDGGSSGSRSQPNVPQTQPLTSVSPARPVKYYPSSYNPNSVFFPAPNSVPLTSTQINPGSQVPRISYPVNPSPQPTPFMNPPAHNSYPSKNSTPSHGTSVPSSSEHSRDVQNTIPAAPSASVQVTVKPATSSHVEKNVDASLVISTPYIEKGASPKLSQQCREASSIHLLKDSGTWPDISSHQLNPSLKPTLTSLPVAGNQSATASPSYAEGTVLNSLSPPPHLEESALIVNSTENRRETINKFDSDKDQQKKQIKKGHSQPHEQVPGGTAESLTVETTSASLNSSRGIVESPKEALPTLSFATSDVPEFRMDSYNPGFTSEASNMVGAPGIFDSSYGDHHVSKNHPRDETLEEKNGGKMVNECPKDKNRSETSNECVSSVFSGVVNETEPNSVTNVAINSHEVGLLQNVDEDFKKPVGHCKRDDVGVDDSVISTSVVLNGDKTSPSDAFRSDSLDSRQAVVPSVSGPTSKHEGEEDAEDVNACTIPVPAVSSNDKLAAELSRSKGVVPRGKKKRKDTLQKADAAGTTSDLYVAYKGPEAKTETVATSESTVSASSIGSKQESIDAIQDGDVSSEKGDQSKNEPEDWEDAADISTPKLESNDEKQVRGGMKQQGEDGYGIMAKKYSRDFLLKFSVQCTELPEGFEITSDTAEALMVSNVNASRESYPSPGRNIDRQSGARSDRRGSGIGDDDKWSKLSGPLASGRDPRMDGYGGNLRPGQGGNYGVLRNPRAQAPAQYSGGILSGPLHSQGPQGSIQRNNSDSDRWQRATAFQKGLMPSPQTPLQVMHKAEKKYQVGKVADEEEAKQRQLKGILNKLTPQNFDKLFEQVKAVNIDSAATLTSVIAQIFDKALMEPTFCEMYANFCSHLAGELPDFSEDNEKITFKRLLLNKCQEEFERGEREQQEADQADIGEVKQSEEEREEKRIKARRRMLGNIRLIGELYKKKMLTERIMHECIKKLLGQYQNPDEEDIEALCKLMSTIGEIIDHPKAKEHMDAYFDMMANLSNNMKLSSRVRFMLRDAIDLRKNKWQQRRKIEGPKKIEEVHRDAAQERQVQAGRLTRGPSMNASVRNRQTMDFGARGSHMVSSASAQMGSFRGLPTQHRGHGIQDVRMDDRHSFDNRTLSVPLPHRPTGEDTITLGPQGGLARGMSIRGQPSMPNSPLPEASSPGDSRRVATGLNGYSSVQDRTVFGSREDLMPRYPSDRFGAPDPLSVQDRNMNYGNRDIRNADRCVERSLPTSPTLRGRAGAPLVSQNVPSDRVWPEERLREMSMAAIKEFYSAKDVKEVALCVKDLNAPSFYPTMISIWVTDSFERKDMERVLLANLLIDLSKSRDGMLSQDHIMKGVEYVLTTLEDAVNDAPKAGEFLGHILAKIILENVIQFTEIGQLIYDGGEEQGRLVKMGLAAEVVGTILEAIKSEKGEPILNEIRSSSSLKLDKFRPPDFKRPLRLDKFL
ncbi:eukaryotic translation initiation factor 4G-like isoform X2 [Diospyros lotus]|uniref:eukaryotic translation initiation factor 4G-like isoform X2 n=1 Tax=Diospyros lotus TaxID=55363 RepID=UPI0022512CE2|nr:eukaryotic translation initiation factor 4G-like isoform X2 [Diospyros lotus]